MIQLVYWFIFFISLSLDQVSARNGCRQCTGVQRITFKTGLLKSDALKFFNGSFLPCATGNNYQLDGVTGTDCELRCIDEYPGLVPRCVLYGLFCKVWSINMRVWRYCGNGGSVHLERGSHALKEITSETDTLSLTCTKSVQCQWNCHCDQCGC